MTMKRITGLRLKTLRVNRPLSITRNKHDQHGDRIQILCDHSSLVRRPFRRTQRGLIYSHCFPSNPVHIDVIVEMMIIYSVLWSNGLFTHVISWTIATKISWTVAILLYWKIRIVKSAVLYIFLWLWLQFLLIP